MAWPLWSIPLGFMLSDSRLAYEVFEQSAPPQQATTHVPNLQPADVVVEQSAASQQLAAQAHDSGLLTTQERGPQLASEVVDHIAWPQQLVAQGHYEGPGDKAVEQIAPSQLPMAWTSDRRLERDVFEQSALPQQLTVQDYTPEQLITIEFGSGLADQSTGQSTPVQQPPAQNVDREPADKAGEQTFPPQQIAAQEFEDNILKLRREGKSMHAIATELGSTYAKVNYAVKHPVSQRNPRGRPKRLTKKYDGANPKKNPKTAIPNKTKQVPGNRPVALDKPQHSRVRESREPGHLESDELHSRVTAKNEASIVPAGAATRSLFEECENLEPKERLPLAQRPSVAQFERRLICVYTKLMLAEMYVCSGIVLHAAKLLLEEMGISASAAPRYLSCRWLVEYLKRHPTNGEEEHSGVNVEGLDDFQRRAVAAVHKLVRRGG